MEMQKSGNMFTGVKNVYTIVFFEKSSKEFHEYSEFKPLYEDIYKMCRNTECIMRFFSEELEIMDNNLAQLMIDEQALVECEKTLVEKDKILSEKDKEIALLRKQLTDAGL